MKHEIMTIEEVAAYLRLKPQTIYTWAQEKKIPAAKIGREWRFKRSLIDIWFMEHIDEKFAGLKKQVEGGESEPGQSES
ncbi:helix-turn-helix domain-containing protein [bacterium]|nr:helix-turn-helix domain-containing protein [bacterium]